MMRFTPLVAAALWFSSAYGFSAFSQQPSRSYYLKNTRAVNLNSPASSFPTYATLNISTLLSLRKPEVSRSASPTALNVWWFGGSNIESHTSGEDSCELVAVRIERTSPNSRRIGGEIIVPRPIDDVWAILTDYDNLAIHVPNLVESKSVVVNTGGRNVQGVAGDGSYRCRLFQKGSQKIVGFDFRASVTLDMEESVMVSGNRSQLRRPDRQPLFPQERRIGFKCVESQFFSVFDGEWKIQSTTDLSTGEPTTTVTYVVDVRPRGPVPVAALEWRIREDVPTNLRAVKKAAIEVGLDGVMKLHDRQPQQQSPKSRALTLARKKGSQDEGSTSETVAKKPITSISRIRSSLDQDGWNEDETMAAYLKD